MRFVCLAKCFLLSLCPLSLLTASYSYYDEPQAFNVHLASGYRLDNFRLRIGAPEKYPRTFSEVNWRELKIAVISASFNYSTLHDYYCRFSADYGKIVKGRGRVSNYRAVPHISSSSDSSSSSSTTTSSSSSDSEPSSMQYSRQRAEADRGNVADFSGGIGWKVISSGGRAWLAAVGGYGYNMQSLHMSHFDQKIALGNFVSTGSIFDLRGDYTTKWQGPWLGVDFSTIVECNVVLYGSAEWHWANFHGSGHWKYADTGYKAHFRNKAVGYGAVGVLGFDWNPCDCWAFGLTGNYQQWSTRKGSNRAAVVQDANPATLIADTFPVVERSHMRRVKWTSYSIQALISYRY